MLKGIRLAMLASVASGALQFATSAHAQDAAAQTQVQDIANTDEKANGEIVVTAQFREQRLQDTPLSITAVSSAMLESRTQANVIDVAKQAPNVDIAGNVSTFGPSISAYIRGVGQFDFNPAYEPGVGIYVDDVYYATLTGANMDLLDLERLEILRGPQGTLTGRNSIGGAIKLVSQKPKGESSGYVQGTFGSRDLLSIRASGDFKFADTLFGRISGVHKSQEGFVDRIDYGCALPGNPQGIPSHSPQGACKGADKLGGENYSAIRALLRWVPDDRLDVLLSADYQTIDRPSGADVLVASRLEPSFICGPTCTYADFRGPSLEATNPRTKYKGWGFSGNVDYEINDDLQLQSITAFRRYDSTWQTDDDFSPVNPAQGEVGFNSLHHRFFSQELRLNAKIGSAIDFTIGGYYANQKTVNGSIQDIGYVIPGVPLQFVGNDPVLVRSSAVFGTTIWHVTDEFTVTAGLRYTHESKDYTFVRKDFSGGTAIPLGIGALNGLTSSSSGSKVDYRVSLDYRFSPSILAYATMSTGFKGGGVSARPFTPAQTLQGGFGPETLTAYEAGLKNTIFGGRGRFNLAAFYNKYSDIQVTINDCRAIDGVAGLPCGVIVNGGDAKFWGIEAEFNANLVGGLSVDASLSYLRAEWKSVDPRAASIRLTDRPTTSPKWNASFGLMYDFDWGQRGTITPRVDVTYTGERFINRPAYLLGGALTLPSYTLVNARLGWASADEELKVSLAVTNLTNKYYAVNQFNAVSGNTNTAYNTLGQPRTFSIEVKKMF